MKQDRNLKKIDLLKFRKGIHTSVNDNTFALINDKTAYD